MQAIGSCIQIQETQKHEMPQGLGRVLNPDPVKPEERALGDWQRGAREPHPEGRMRRGLAWDRSGSKSRSGPQKKRKKLWQNFGLS